MTACKRVIYTGRVQGVGFRYTARRLAEGYAVSGYVRNRADGSVELVAEGEAAEVGRFLQALAGQMGPYLKGCTENDESPAGYRGFVIRG
jgi:acylphosphatase